MYGLIPKAFAAFCTDDNIRMNSSSGGMYPLLAADIIQRGGCVWAACYTSDNKVEHRRISDKNEIALACGAKYLASRLNGAAEGVYHDLRNGIPVLFVGLPCQCAALHSYLNTKEDGESRKELLLCVDMVCHGVGTDKAWNMYINEKEKSKGARLLSVNMRDKRNGWTGYGWSLHFSDGSEEYKHHDENIYMRGYKHDLFLRTSCYDCRFKGTNRFSDITLGDLWGIEQICPDFSKDNKGVSLVILNSDKGMSSFEALSDRIQTLQIDYNDACKYNPSIIKSSDKRHARDMFFEKLEKTNNFHKTVKKMTKEPLRARISSAIVKVKIKIKGLLKHKI